jgi:formylglycine-generating enzyme
VSAMKAKIVQLGGLGLLAWACSKGQGADGAGGNATSMGGRLAAGGGSSTGGSRAGGGTPLAGNESSGSGGSLPSPMPKYHPPPGFEDCKHAEVRTDCKDGWCKLPPSCFVMGSPESDWGRGRDDETQIAVRLTHSIEIQQKELTRAEWETITKTSSPGPDNCTEATCPVAMVSWWDAVHAADLLSTQQKLEPCYEPVDCTGALGKDLVCARVKDPEKSVYECEGYRLPTRTEAEFAARAGTTSTFYSGEISPREDPWVCEDDPALSVIGWYCHNSGLRPHKGCELMPNGFGLCDLIGNLLEWNNDQMAFASSPGGADPRGIVGTGRDRAIYNGQYDGVAITARAAGLLTAPWDLPGGNQGGFRLVRTLDPKP